MAEELQRIKRVRFRGFSRAMKARGSPAAVNGGEQRWMPKMEPTGLFISKGREDERAKVEDKLAKCCG